MPLLPANERFVWRSLGIVTLVLIGLFIWPTLTQQNRPALSAKSVSVAAVGTWKKNDGMQRIKFTESDAVVVDGNGETRNLSYGFVDGALLPKEAKITPEPGGVYLHIDALWYRVMDVRGNMLVLLNETTHANEVYTKL